MNEKNWGDTKPEVGAVLGLKVENLSEKVSFEVFREKAKTYILGDFKNPKDVLSIITELVNPMVDFKKSNEPDKLTQKEKIV